MEIRHVIVEVLRQPQLEISLLATGPDADQSALMAAASVPGFAPDRAYGAVRMPSAASSRTLAAAPEDDAPETVLLRGVIDESQLDTSAYAEGPKDGVVGVFADCEIAGASACGNSPAVGDHLKVAKLLGRPALKCAGMDGSSVLVAIVDSGINLAHLRNRLGWTPRLDEERSWFPPLAPGQPNSTPGRMPVGHGTMCAFDALIAAPEATLLDLPILDSRLPGWLQHRLSDAIKAFDHLVRVIDSLGRPGDHHSLVVNNSWGVFQKAWDLPAGHPGRYVDNPVHPFNRIVGRLERAGADILFAAGNCGRECPDGRCGGARDEGILGANSHPSVLSVAGVDLKKRRVGYSTRGPGLLDPQKPDLAGYTHFRGSGVTAFDGGTSAATPVVAGVVAAYRSRFPSDPDHTPAMLRDLFRTTAEPVGEASFDIETGHGIVSGTRLLAAIQAEAADGDRDVGEPGADEDDDAFADEDDETFADKDDADSPEDDEEFLFALLAFDADFHSKAAKPGKAGKAGKGCSGCGPCAEGSPCTGQEPATDLEDITMSDNDRELLRALNKFGTPNAEDNLFADVGDADDMDDMDDMDDDGFDLDDGESGGGDDDRAFLAALAQYGAPQMAAAGLAAGQDLTAAPGLAQVCRVWRSVRPIIRRILSFLGRIPVIGGGLVGAVNTLTRLLDAVCRGGNPANLCRQWRGGLRAIMLRVASVVRRIPLIGGRAARAIRTLISAIDALCRLL
jgi:hypothetical protein